MEDNKRERELEMREQYIRFRDERTQAKIQGTLKGIVIIVTVHSILIGMLLAKILFLG